MDGNLAAMENLMVAPEEAVFQSNSSLVSGSRKRSFAESDCFFAPMNPISTAPYSVGQYQLTPNNNIITSHNADHRPLGTLAPSFQHHMMTATGPVFQRTVVERSSFGTFITPVHSSGNNNPTSIAVPFPYAPGNWPSTANNINTPVTTTGNAFGIPYGVPNNQIVGNVLQSGKQARVPPLPVMSAYKFYSDEMHYKLKAFHPNREREFSDVIKTSWNGLDEEQKKIYHTFGKRDAKRYRTELKEYLEKMDFQDQGGRKIVGMPFGP